MPNAQIRAATFIEKGGVGKTTACAHLGRTLAEEYNVLLMDLAGRQNDLAMQFGIEDDIHDPEIPINVVFGDSWEIISREVDALVEKMTFDTGVGPDLIPSHPGLEGADNDLASVDLEERFVRLRSFVEDYLDEYDVILFDLPGKESNIALNGLVAAEHVITPIKPGAFERSQLESLPDILTEIAEDTPVTPELVLIMPNAVDSQKKIHQQFLEYIEDEYPDLTAPTIVPDSANVEAAPEEGRTVFDMESDELYSTGKRARDAYQDAATELTQRL
jgi:chromosome partitioning protein